jgi:ATP-dependent Clp protease ATP-binding subunit ClpB
MKHNAIDVMHLFFAMLQQKDGFIPSILKKSQIDSSHIQNQIQQELSKLPTIE